MNEDVSILIGKEFSDEPLSPKEKPLVHDKCIGDQDFFNSYGDALIYKATLKNPTVQNSIRVEMEWWSRGIVRWLSGHRPVVLGMAAALLIGIGALVLLQPGTEVQPSSYQHPFRVQRVDIVVLSGTSSPVPSASVELMSTDKDPAAPVVSGVTDASGKFSSSEGAQNLGPGVYRARVVLGEREVFSGEVKPIIKNGIATFEIRVQN